MSWLLWLGAAIVLAIIEMLSTDFFFIMLGGGAVAGMAAALLGAPLWAQVLAFAVVAILLLLIARPAAKDWMARSTPASRTNAHALLGRPAVVLSDVTEQGGRVKLAGEVWTARAAYLGETIPEDAGVVVVAIEGAYAVVARPDDPRRSRQP